MLFEDFRATQGPVAMGPRVRRDDDVEIHPRLLAARKRPSYALNSRPTEQPCWEKPGDRSASRLALARPRLRRLTALTPSAHRSVGFASARSRTERGGRTRSAQRVAARIPFLASCDHGVEDDNELAHAGDDGNLRLFSFGNQALIVGLQNGIVQRGGANTGHVDGVTDPAAATLDVAFAASLSAIIVIGGNAYQGRGDPVAHLAEFRHPCNKVCGARLSKTRHTLDDLGAFGKIRHGLDFGADGGLEPGNLADQALQDVGMRFLNQSRRRMLALAYQAHPKINQT